jgi:tRNA (guanine-N7-)-methyltransferase
MPRTLKTDIPGEDWRVSPEQARQQGWREIFASHLEAGFPLVVEIGFGRGEFIVDLATRNPGTAFVGVEYNRRRVLKMARRLARQEFRNIRLVEAMGQEVVCDMPVNSVSEFWVNFSDPWPKKRHAKNRFLQAETIHAMALRLVPGGLLHVATDHEGYAEFIQERIPKETLLENALAPRPFVREMPERMVTVYQEIWREKGSTPYFWEFQRVDRDPLPEEATDPLMKGLWCPRRQEG